MLASLFKHSEKAKLSSRTTQFEINPDDQIAPILRIELTLDKKSVFTYSKATFQFKILEKYIIYQWDPEANPWEFVPLTMMRIYEYGRANIANLASQLALAISASRIRKSASYHTHYV